MVAVAVTFCSGRNLEVDGHIESVPILPDLLALDPLPLLEAAPELL
jgi:hypothetical protein